MMSRPIALSLNVLTEAGEDLVGALTPETQLEPLMSNCD